MTSLTRLLERNLRITSGGQQIRLLSAQASPTGSETEVDDEGDNNRAEIMCV